jgi:hypothetical protein
LQAAVAAVVTQQAQQAEQAFIMDLPAVLVVDSKAAAVLVL